MTEMRDEGEVGFEDGPVEFDLETDATTAAGESSGERTAEASSAASSVVDLVSRALTLGLGAAALTVDKVQEVADDFVHRGQMTTEEGKEMVNRLTDRSRGQARSALRSLDSSLQSTYREMGIATRREFEDLDFRLRQVEHRLGLVESRVDAGSGGSSSPSGQ